MSIGMLIVPSSFTCNFNYKNTKILAIIIITDIQLLYYYVHYRNYYNFRSVKVNYWYYHIIYSILNVFTAIEWIYVINTIPSWTLYTDSLRVAIELLNQQSWR